MVPRPDGSLLLVDAGFDRATVAAPEHELGDLMARTLHVVITPGDAIADQLLARGLDPGRVTTVVATHLHLDHVSGLRDLPNARLVCSIGEVEAWRAARWPPGAYRRQDLDLARVDAVPLDGPPRWGFPASHDLYGDGSVVLLDATGHTAGQVAVAIQGGDTRWILTGDAADQVWEYGLSPPGPSIQAGILAWSRARLKETYGFLRAAEADPERPRLVPAHDLGVFEGLPHG